MSIFTSMTTSMHPFHVTLALLALLLIPLTAPATLAQEERRPPPGAHWAFVQSAYNAGRNHDRLHAQILSELRHTKHLYGGNRSMIEFVMDKQNKRKFEAMKRFCHCPYNNQIRSIQSLRKKIPR